MGKQTEPTPDDEKLQEPEAGPACRVCGCTEYAACTEGCGWVRESARRARERCGPICTVCEDLVREVAHRARAHAAGLTWQKLLEELEDRVEDGGRERVARAIGEALLRGDVDALITVRRSKR